MRCAGIACITHPTSPQQPIVKLTIVNFRIKAVHTIISQAIKTASKHAKLIARLLTYRTCKTDNPRSTS